MNKRCWIYKYSKWIVNNERINGEYGINAEAAAGLQWSMLMKMKHIWLASNCEMSDIRRGHVFDLWIARTFRWVKTVESCMLHYKEFFILNFYWENGLKSEHLIQWYFSCVRRNHPFKNSFVFEFIVFSFIITGSHSSVWKTAKERFNGQKLFSGQHNGERRFMLNGTIYIPFLCIKV